MASGQQHVSFAGVTLPLTTPEHQEWLRRVHPQTDFLDWSAWNFEGFDTARLPTPPWPEQPPFEFGVLYWPTGAVRPAWYHQVVTTAQLQEIRDAVGDPMTPQDFYLQDGRAGKEITASMYMLPPRPLNQLGVNENEDGWVLTLTDRRFYWHWRRGIITQPVSWADLFAQLGTILGVTISVDTIDPDLDTVPSSKWQGYYRPTATVLDAAAEQVGQRVVVALDGTVRTVNWDAAKAASDANNTDARLVSGGNLVAADVGRYVPARVDVLFADDSSGTLVEAPFVVSRPLTLLGIAEYGTEAGVTGTNMALVADLAYDGTNAGTVNAYATALATAWYGWRLADVDEVFPGVEPWAPTGWEDWIRWTVQVREKPFATTRVCRGEWDDFTSGSWLPSEPPPPDEGCDTATAWPYGLENGWCLRFSVVEATGRCVDIDTTQTAEMRDGPNWTTQFWDPEAGESGEWAPWYFQYDGGSGVVTFWISTTYPFQPRLKIGDCELAWDPTCVRDNCVRFIWGPQLDGGGGSGGSCTLCDGDAPDPCEPNWLVVQVCCDCCSFDGWQGPGWYCIDVGDGCPGTPVEILEADRCADVVYCSGPYPDFDTALAACGTLEPIACCYLSLTEPEQMPTLCLRFLDDNQPCIYTSDTVTLVPNLAVFPILEWKGVYKTNNCCLVTAYLTCTEDGMFVRFGQDVLGPPYNCTATSGVCTGPFDPGCVVYGTCGPPISGVATIEGSNQASGSMVCSTPTMVSIGPTPCTQTAPCPVACQDYFDCIGTAGTKLCLTLTVGVSPPTPIGSVEMTYDAGTGDYVYTGPVPTCDSPEFEFRLRCTEESGGLIECLTLLVRTSDMSPGFYNTHPFSLETLNPLTGQFSVGLTTYSCSSPFAFSLFNGGTVAQGDCP